MFILEPGKSYTVNLTVTNRSTRANMPTAATLGVGILAVTASVINLIAKQVSQQAFGPGQTRTFYYSMAIPQEAAGSTGGITAWIEDPAAKKIAQAVESIIVSPYLVSFSGVVTDAETKLPLSGVIVEMKSGDELITSTTTNSAGYYQIENIPVPATYVFVYRRSGYRDTVTDLIYLDPSGGGLNIALVPLVPTKLVLYYTNPNTSPTHWDVYDLDRGVWLSAGELAKRIGEAYVFTPQNLSSLFLCFREAVNVFFDISEYGPYVIPIAGLGEYTWNARRTELNGVKAVSLMNTSGSIRGKVISQEETNVPGYKLLTLQVLSATGSPGDYFVGKTIKVEAQVEWSLVGLEIIGNLKVQSSSPGNYQYYPGFVLIISNITYPLGLPDYLYAIAGGTSMGYNDNGSFSIVGIQWYSKYGLGGIPIRFVASADGVQRNITLRSGITYEIGSPGTQSLQRTLPTSTPDYWDPWLYIYNLDAIPRCRVNVSLWTGTYWKGVATIQGPG